MKKSNYAFIDGNNLILGLKNQNWKIDYSKFYRFLKDKYRIEKAFWFIGYVAKNKSLYKNLRNAGFDLVFKKTTKQKNGETKGNIDVLLCVHCFEELDNFDEIFLVSGDGDFVDLINFVKKQNKNFRIIIPNRKYLPTLFKAFEKNCIYLSNPNLRKKLEHKKR